MADYALTQTGAEVQSILDSVDDIQTDVETLQTDVGTLEEDVGTLQTDMDTAQGDISSLQTAVSGKASVAISTTVTLASASWTSGTLYTQAVTVSGLLATDVPFCQAVCDDETDAEAWGAIIKATPTADTLTFTATEAPSVDLDIQVVVFK